MVKNFSVKVTPRASKNELVGSLSDAEWKVRLTAAPTDGKANEALIRLISDTFDIAKSRIRIVKGEASRKKVVEIYFLPS